MRKPGTGAALMVMIVSTAFGAASPAVSGASVLPPTTTVDGLTIGDYTAKFWQWTLSFTAPNDPFTDPTGALAGLNQSGPVFFVAGTAGGGPVTRAFTAPAGKYLLVPLLAGELSQLEIGFDKTAAQVRQAAKEQADLIDELHASINGVAVPNLFSYRVASPDFSFTAAAGNPIGVPPGASGIAVADGYFLLISPLAVGEKLVLNFGGGISEFDFRVDVTANITAVPEPGAYLQLGAGLVVLLGTWTMKRAAASFPRA